MSKGEAIGANVLERICETMQCNVGDVMDYVPETHRIQGDNDGDNLVGGQRTCQMYAIRLARCLISPNRSLRGAIQALTPLAEVPTLGRAGKSRH